MTSILMRSKLGENIVSAILCPNGQLFTKNITYIRNEMNDE